MDLGLASSIRRVDIVNGQRENTPDQEEDCRRSGGDGDLLERLSGLGKPKDEKSAKAMPFASVTVDEGLTFPMIWPFASSEKFTTSFAKGFPFASVTFTVKWVPNTVDWFTWIS